MVGIYTVLVQYRSSIYLYNLLSTSNYYTCVQCKLHHHWMPGLHIVYNITKTGPGFTCVLWVEGDKNICLDERVAPSQATIIGYWLEAGWYIGFTAGVRRKVRIYWPNVAKVAKWLWLVTVEYLDQTKNKLKCTKQKDIHRGWP